MKWVETQFSYNRTPLFSKIKQLLEGPQQRAKLSNLDLDASWFSVLYSFHKIHNVANHLSIFSEDPSVPQRLSSFLATYKFSENGQIELKSLVQEDTAPQDAFWHTSDKSEQLASKNLQFKLCQSLSTHILQNCDHSWVLEDVHGDFSRFMNRVKEPHQFLWGSEVWVNNIGLYKV